MLKITWKIGALSAAVALLIIVTARTYCLDPLQEARCLNCIKNVTNLLGVDLTKRCEGYYCGQYQLSYSYWVEAGKPGNSQGARDFEKCARDKSCAEQAVKAYFKKFKRDCNSDGIIDCHDMAALHKAGPTSCTSDWFYKSRYWQAFNRTTCATNRDQPSEDIRIELEEQNKQPMREMKNQSLTQDCLDCICDAVSGCNTSVNNCGSGAVCGPFAISQTYWKDGRKPGASWTACARTKECSMVTVKNYMEKNRRDCNGDGLITCEDYAAIHRRGPRACINRDLFKDHYWNKFQACRANQKPHKDVNMVKVYEDGDYIPSSNQNSLVSRDDGSITTSTFQSSTPTASLMTTLSSTLASSTTTTTTIATATKTTTPSTPTFVADSMMETFQHQSFQPLAHEQQQQQQHQQQQHQQQQSDFSQVIDLNPMNSEPSPSTNTVVELPRTDSYTTTTSPTSPPSTAATLRQVEVASAAVASVAESQPPPPEIEHSVPPFPFAMPADFDKATSFDRVATGIFANPDFTKSYPPMPEISHAQDKAPAPEQPVALPTQQRPNSPPSRGPPQMQQPASPLTANRPGEAVSSNQRPKPSMHNQKNPTDQHQQQLVDRASGQGGDQLIGALSHPIWGPDSMNISNLFDKGLNESSRIASECLDCICDASSNCDTTVQCISKQREKNRCGLYMISWNQYQESDIMLTSLIPVPTGLNEETLDERLYYECTTDRACAEKLIHLYIEKHQKDCNNDGKIDCYDIAAIHRVGPDSCNSGKFLSSQYWKDFNICYTTDRFSTTQSTAPTTTPAPN